MNQLLVFNHHSLPFQSRETATNAIPEFLKVCIRAGNLGLSTLLVDDSVDRNWFRLQLADGFYWQDWYNQNVNNDLQKNQIRAFRSIQTRQPFFLSEDIGEGLESFEVRFGEENEYAALTAAVWYDSPIVSFPTVNPWNNSPIHVEVNEINEDTTVTTYETAIHNFYSSRVLDRFESDLLSKRNESIKSTREILYRKDELYHFIEFCGKAPEQLLNTVFNQSILDQIKESISALNLFCEKWKNGEYVDYSHDNVRDVGLNHKVSGESATVLQNRNLRKEREFYLPNGYKVLFENHIKIANGFRIHFYPDSDNRKIFIGYIGTHLRLN